MKKGSGFEKFFKEKPKTGAAKKENIRQEKRVVRKEREDQIANAKREKRAKFRTASSGEPPKYNLEPPTNRFAKKGRDERPERGREERPKPVYKQDRNRNEERPKPTYKQEHKKPDNRPRQASTGNSKRIEIQPKTERNFSKRSDQNNRQGPVEKKFGEKKNYKNDSAKIVINKPAVTKPEPKKKIGHNDANHANRQGDKTPNPAAINRPHTESELMPLNKYIAHSGVCSRRDAVDLIKGGKVKVNGELVLEPGHKVAISDDVKVAGKQLTPVKDFVYILLNKPKDYITTTDDPQQRKTVFDLLKAAPAIRIYPVGRLDRNTSGVLLLTNDGDLSQKLTHPSNEIKKVYAVTLDKPLTKHHFETILQGVPLEDGIAYVDSLAFTDAQDLTQLGIELHTGRNRIVRRLFEHFGYDVKALDRVIFAGLTKKNITRGKWRYLNEKEVRDLKFFKKGRK